ncbi:synaptic vesicle glycoprotein 2C-like isoform X2 [Zophobas morio]|uniref:synaptic vesicle glycoprotein 2C-like isoform X2 n=1 Tax=Zophobas morio TaxID=2755281 RepID=UPI0030833D06
MHDTSYLLSNLEYASSLTKRMISSGVIWGFLFDTLGRRKLLMIGYFLDFLCVLVSAFSQTKAMLITAKFFGGFIINGPYSALSTYVSEFHSAKNRGRMQLFIAIVFCWGGIAFPWLSWGILSNNIHFSIFNDSLRFYSWNILLLICCLPPIISAIAFAFMPESPKFLMTVGENEKALALFQKMYSINKRQPPETFPIKQLVNETELKKTSPNQHGGQVTAKRSQIEALREGWQQIRPLFFPPFLLLLLLICSIQALFTMSVNTFRLWLPQIFQALNDYQYYYDVSSVDLCKSLELIRPSNQTDCEFNVDNASVYLNSMIVNITVMLCEILTACLINSINKKTLLFVLGVFAGGCLFILYFSVNTTFAVSFAALFTGLSTSAANVVVIVNIALFPTTLRTMSLATALMCGRIGSMIGNLVFPLLIQAGCAPPFFTIGSLAIVSSFVSLLLPNSDMKELI